MREMHTLTSCSSVSDLRRSSYSQPERHRCHIGGRSVGECFAVAAVAAAEELVAADETETAGNPVASCGPTHPLAARHSCPPSRNADYMNQSWPLTH